MKKTIEYRLKGTRCLCGAIGTPEKFKVTVYRQTGTMTPKEAMSTARLSMHEDGFDHILFTSCEVKKSGKWVNIPMLEALGLE